MKKLVISVMAMAVLTAVYSMPAGAVPLAVDSLSSYAKATKPWPSGNNALAHQSFENRAATNPPVQLMSLQQVQDLAMQHHLANSSWPQRQQLAQAKVRYAGLRPVPQLVLEQMGWQGDSERELSVALVQPLDVFGQRKARQQLATLQVEQENWLKTASEAQLQLVAAVLYWRLAQAEWAAQLASQQATLSQQSLNAAQQRLAAGRIAQVDYQRVQVAHQSQLSQWQTARAQQQAAQLQLSQLWPNQPPVPVSTGQAIQWPSSFKLTSSESISPKSSSSDVSTALEKNPLLQQLEQQYQQASVTLKLAQIEAKPQPVLSLGYVNTRETAPQETSKRQRIAVGLSLPLPLFRSNAAVMQAQQAMQHINQQQASQQRQILAQQQHYEQLAQQALAQQYQQLTQQQLPLAQQIQQKTVQGFVAGKFGVFEVQQATRDYQQLQREQLELLRHAWQLSLAKQALALGLAQTDINSSTVLYDLNRQISQSGSTLLNNPFTQ